MSKLAWDGFGFELPDDWNLSGYAFARHTASLQVEDDEDVRLEFDWTRSTKPMATDQVDARYFKQSRKLTAFALDTTPVDTLPAHWTGFVYGMPDKRHLAVAHVIGPHQRFFGILRLHFRGVGGRKPARVLERVTRSFQLHEGPMRPWSVYDMDYTLPAEFRLLHTAFEGGRKLFCFQWRLRKLWLWQFSLAELLLRDQTPAQYAAGFLNARREFGAVRFTANGDGLDVARPPRFPLFLYDELGRACLRYQASIRHLPDRNALFLAVFNHRRPDDLAALQGAAGSTTAAVRL